MIRAEINEVENKKTIENSVKLRVGISERQTKLTPLASFTKGKG